MRGEIPEFAVLVRLKNNRIRQRRLELGLSVAKLAAASGASLRTCYELEAMAASPLKSRDRGWTLAATKLATFFRVTPEDLFPESIQQVKQASVERQLAAEQVGALLGAAPDDWMALLPSPEDVVEDGQRARIALSGLERLRPRDREVIERRFGIGRPEQTLEEIGQDFELNRERIRQIEARALRKLAHPSSGLAAKLGVTGRCVHCEGEGPLAFHAILRDHYCCAASKTHSHCGARPPGAK